MYAYQIDPRSVLVPEELRACCRRIPLVGHLPSGQCLPMNRKDVHGNVFFVDLGTRERKSLHQHSLVYFLRLSGHPSVCNKSSRVMHPTRLYMQHLLTSRSILGYNPHLDECLHMSQTSMHAIPYSIRIGVVFQPSLLKQAPSSELTI